MNKATAVGHILCPLCLHGGQEPKGWCEKGMGGWHHLEGCCLLGCFGQRGTAFNENSRTLLSVQLGLYIYFGGAQFTYLYAAFAGISSCKGFDQGEQ